MARILVTGAGGGAGVNFIRALRYKTQHYIVGTEFNKYYSIFPEVDKMVDSPRHSDPKFLPLIKNIIKEYRIDFVHPQPTVEMLVLAENRDALGATTFLPTSDIIQRDKHQQYKLLTAKNVEVSKSIVINSEDEFNEISNFNYPLWVRAKTGAGGRLSIKCNSANEVAYWIKLWISKGHLKWSDFMIQEYLSGRDVAWDSLWYKGNLIESFARERLDYPFKHLTPSGITGTPTVSKIIHDSKINKFAESAVKAIDDTPHGCYSVDLKEDANGKPMITEIDSGKFHTTIGLWGYIAMNNLGMEWHYNMPQLYVQLGIGNKVPSDIKKFDIYPDQLYLIRQIDCGVWIAKNDGWKERVI